MTKLSKGRATFFNLS
uniref:Uncharacterized protein n=1 Tax=Anguilla anguilla TaxID=7936 RepID=A0A0E9XVB0_ANGAN